ncbi:hypothetical protein Avbf_13871 [Armadillidium vulgare]|nr:hypothetical protein Avbf_13871 [Armadillidium vulgare]
MNISICCYIFKIVVKILNLIKGDCVRDPFCPTPEFITHECTSDSDCKAYGQDAYCRGTMSNQDFEMSFHICYLIVQTLWSAHSKISLKEFFHYFSLHFNRMEQIIIYI